jgi:hypothetical protein
MQRLLTDPKTYPRDARRVVMLTLYVDESSGKPEYSVDPATLKTIYGGYTTK